MVAFYQQKRIAADKERIRKEEQQKRRGAEKKRSILNIEIEVFRHITHTFSVRKGK